MQHGHDEHDKHGARHEWKRWLGLIGQWYYGLFRQVRGERIFLSLQLIQSYHWPEVILKQPYFILNLHAIFEVCCGIACCDLG